VDLREVYKREGQRCIKKIKLNKALSVVYKNPTILIQAVITAYMKTGEERGGKI